MKRITYVLVVAIVAAGCQRQLSVAPRPVPVIPVHAPYDPSLIDKDIAFWKAKTKYDPTGSIGWSMLANAYLKRGSESDSMEAAQSAENAARTSLKFRRAGNVGAANTLVAALLQQHEFTNALAAVDDALAIRPDNVAAIRQKIDVLIELGRYEQAKQLLALHAKDLEDPSGLALRARWSELRGDRSSAIAMLKEANDKMAMNAGASRETLAWFRVKLGTTYLFGGQTDDAERHLKAALETYPRSYKAMIAMQRVAEARKDWKAMADWGHRAEEIVTMPESLAMIGKAYAKLGDKKQAEEHFAEAIAAAGAEPLGHTHSHSKMEPKVHGHPLDRQLALILAHLSRRPARAVQAAKLDVSQRPDIWAYDALAWAEHNAGNAAAARAAMNKALSLGTKDIRLEAHAKEIFEQK